ncbi:MAG: ZIP family metal transporter [Candidatus Doudnabacteria bacterium]|nr:ZIP family metal transporter [Candidatus Doudnabacteria bacterium]
MLILFGLIAGLFSLVGGVLLTLRMDWVRKAMLPLLAFAAGSFMGVSFLDLFPEAVEAVAEPHYIFAAALAGFFLFFVLERLFTQYAHKDTEDVHNHSEHTEAISWLVVIGDSLHNLLDGVVIALVYIANPAVGLSTAFAIAAHEIPQEIGDFAVLLDRGWSRAKVIAVNVLSSLLNLVGIAIGYYGGMKLEGSLPYLLAGVGGIFVYIAACDLIPEVQDRAKHKFTGRILLAFLFGLGLTAYLALRAHGTV